MKRKWNKKIFAIYSFKIKRQANFENRNYFQMHGVYSNKIYRNYSALKTKNCKNIYG